MNNTNKPLRLYISDILRFLSSPSKWTQKQYLSFFIFLVIVAICFTLDQTVRGFFLSIHSPGSDLIFAIVDKYGKGYIQMLCFLILVFAGLRYNGQWLIFAHRLIESVLLSGIVVNALKMTVGRWRPFTGNGNLYFTPFVFLSDTGRLSLPSADVALAFSSSLIMAEIFDSKAWKITWYFMAFLTALGRIYHDKHWLSDTVISAVLCLYVVQWIKEYSAIK